MLPGLPAAAAETALLRVAHLSPDTPAVTLSVTARGTDGVVPPQELGYGDASTHQEVPPGTYAVSVRAVGAAPGSPPVLSSTVELPAGAARTVAAVGSFADLRLVVLDDDRTPPPAGAARVRVVAAAAGTPSLDVTADGVVVAGGLRPPEAGSYVAVPAGATALQLRSGGAPADVPVELAAGSLYSLLVLDRPDGGLTVRVLLDAAGAAVVPTGGIETGAGGTAGRSPLPAVVAGAALAAAVLTVLRLRARIR
ncbi:DUF4397 domain-containing protein [Geodermatophilus sp. SYSU D00705]